MRPLDRLSEYLGAVERRLRVLAVTRGIAVTAGLALALTVLAVLIANQFAFSNISMISARVFVFLGLALAIAAALIVPVIRLNRRHAARKAEMRFPQFEERLLTFTENVQRERLRLLDERVPVRVGLHADDDERRLERHLRHPVHGARGHLPILVRRGQHVEAVGNHAQRGLLHVGVHRTLLGASHTVWRPR